MKKGFTLIELLAVIVILAVIAVIAVPIVLNIINDTKESATLRSAEFYLRGLETSIATSVLNNIQVPDGKHFIMEDGNICLSTLNNNRCTGDILKVEMDGEVPTEGTITIKDGEIKKVDLILSDKEIWIDPFTGKIEYKPAPGLYDENDKLIKTWEELNEISQNEYGMNFKELVESDDANDDYTGYAGIVVDSIQGAYQLILDNSVTKIGDYAFNLSYNLKSLIIPDSVTSIGICVLDDSNIESIVFGAGVTSFDTVSRIGYNFSMNYTITTIIVDPDNPIYDSRDNCNAIIETATNTLLLGGGNTVIPKSVTSIEEAFYGRSNLTSITIPSSVTHIGSSAFAETSLESITIPESVTSIGEEAFANGWYLTEVTILSNEINIAESAFYDCEKLTTIYYNGNIEGATWIPEGVTVKPIGT